MNKLFSIAVIVFLLMGSYSGLVGSRENLNGMVSSTCNFENTYISTFLGGSYNDGDFYKGSKVASYNDMIIVAGTTISVDFPFTLDSYDNELNGDADIFIAIFNEDLTDLISSTALGGSYRDEVRDMKIDKNGNIYVIGSTESADFPITMNAYDSEYDSGTEMPYGSGDIFVAKFNNDLTTLISSTYLGGRGHDYANAIEIDEAGNVYITGSTSSSNFPVTDNAYSKNLHSGGVWGDDIFVSKFNSDLTNLLASTFLGGSGDDYSEQIEINNNGDVIISGWTSSTNFPTLGSSYDSAFNGGIFDGIISIFDGDFSILQCSSYLGGTDGWDFVYGMIIDDSGNICVTGHTSSPDYPVTTGAYDVNYNGIGGQTNDDNVFLTIFNSDITVIISSTFLGGKNGFEIGYDIIQDDEGHIYVTGTTKSNDFPTTNNAFDTSYNGHNSKWSGDVFISKFDFSLKNLMASTFIGGRYSETGTYIDIKNNNLLIAGHTKSSSFPVTDDSYDHIFNGLSDVFVLLINEHLSINGAPVKPNILGPSSGKIDEEYTFITSTTDSDGDQIYYLFDWGDESDSGWIGPFDSGEEIEASHIWTEKGSFEIKVKAKDIYGAESEWSDPLHVSMPRYRSLSNIELLKLFDWFYDCFPFINFLINNMRGEI